MKKRIFTIGLLLTLVLPLFAFDFFFDDFDEGPKGPTRNITFEAVGGMQVYADDWSVAPAANLTFKAEQDGANYQVIAELNYDSQIHTILTDKRPTSFDELPFSVEELSLSLFMGSFTLKAGLMRHNWGSADTASVVDVVNPRDMRRGILDDPDKMKRPDYMVTLTKYWENNTLDVVFKPSFKPSWVAFDDSKFSIIDPSMTEVIDVIALRQQLKSAGLPDPVIDAIILDIETNVDLDIDLQQDIMPLFQAAAPKTLKNFSAGARYRFTFDPLEVALMYYYGYNHDPGFTLELYNISALDEWAPKKGGKRKAAYTRHQFVGFSSSYFFEPFTFALEGGMFISEDKGGAAPELYNSKLVYLAEFSYTNPNNAIFMAFNYQGSMVLSYDPEPRASYPYLDADLMAAFNYRPYQNNFALALEVPFMRERLKARVAGTYQMESTGYAIMTSLTYEFEDDLQLYAKSTIYGTIKDRTGMFNTWKDNTWIQVGVRAWF